MAIAGALAKEQITVTTPLTIMPPKAYKRPDGPIIERQFYATTWATINFADRQTALDVCKVLGDTAVNEVPLQANIFRERDSEMAREQQQAALEYLQRAGTAIRLLSHILYGVLHSLASSNGRARGQISP